MSRISLLLCEKSNVTLSLGRFSTIAVTFVPSQPTTRHGKAGSMATVSLEGANADENTLTSWCVGDHFYLAKPETEISLGRDGLTETKTLRERFNYLRLHPGGTHCTMSLPDCIRSLTIIADQGYRDEPKGGQPQSSITMAAPGANMSNTLVHLRASGVALSVVDGIRTKGTVINPASVHIPPGSELRSLTAPKRAWILPETLAVWKTSAR